MVIFKMTAGAAGFGILEIRCVEDARPSGYREGIEGKVALSLPRNKLLTLTA
jgi:hypothetical protein